MTSFEEVRKDFYDKISDFWPDLYGEEYAIYDISLISERELNEIRFCTKRVGHLFFKVCDLLRHVPDSTLLAMGFPKETLDFIRLKTLFTESVIARLDLIKTEHTYKCIEINADTPTFIKELFHINGLAANKFGVDDLNAKMEYQLANSIRKAVSASLQYVEEIEPYIVFTAHEDNIEDKNTVLYLMKLFGRPAKFIPINCLVIKPGEGLFDNQDRKIDLLYRQTIPIENLITDEDIKGNKIGQWLLELVQNRKLAILNPPSSFLLQNKAVMAVIWGMHETNDSYFTKKEHEWIEEYFLPTYLEPDHFLGSGAMFVKKPIFGREGDTVQLFNSSGSLFLKEAQQSYSNVPAIYQQYSEMPVISFQSINGPQTGHQLIGSFLINGQPSAVGFRVGGKITNNLSCYLPAGLTKGGGAF